MGYENLLIEAEQRGIYVYEKRFKSKAKGLCKGNVIAINSATSNREKYEVLAEEIGHHYTSSGDILDQSDCGNRKQERRARAWAYQRLISLDRIVEAGQAGVSGRHDIAEWLDVTEEFLQDSVNYYRDKYDVYATHKGYKIKFEPLIVEKIY